jgi:hypothetical protein
MDTTEKFVIGLFIIVVTSLFFIEPLAQKETKEEVKEVQYCTSPDGAFEAPCWTFRKK